MSKKMTLARSKLLLDHPFFGVLAIKLTLREDPAIETAGTDGKELIYNPKWIEELSLPQTIGLVAHEVMHLALGHPWRKEKREHSKWNVACDYAINTQLLRLKFELPAKGMIDEKYADKSAEEIYSLLPELSKEQSQSSDPGKCGEVLDSPGNTPQEKEEALELEQEWKMATVQALSTQEGKMICNLKKELKEITEPVVPWTVLLRDFVQMTARNDYNWTRPSPRYFSSGIILPSLVSEELPEVVIAIDTSGSINDELLSKFMNEVSEVLGAFDTKIHLVCCSNHITHTAEYGREDLPIKEKIVGGGGTDFKPVFEYIAKQEINPACLIYQTDLFGTFPNMAPEYPVLWITSTKENTVKVPFGTTIAINY